MRRQHAWFRGSGSYLSVTLLLTIALVFSVLYAVNLGSASISMADAYHVMSVKLFGGELREGLPRAIVDIIWHIRLPRLVLAVVVGSGLALCGIVMQAIVKNPLADPYILGISSGASLGATLAILFGVGTFFGANFVGVMAFLMALGVAFTVLLLANLKSPANPTKLVLAGIAVGAMCSALSSMVIFITDDRDGLQTVMFWLMGSFAGAKWDVLDLLIPLVLVICGFFVLQYRNLNLMLLGDQVAITLGKNLQRYRQLYLILASLLIGFLVFSAGIIGFVGLIIPHLARLMFGTDHKKLIPVSALLGALLMVWSDVASRTIVPGNEIPVGVITALLGAPGFLYLMINKSYGFAESH